MGVTPQKERAGAGRVWLLTVMAFWAARRRGTTGRSAMLDADGGVRKDCYVRREAPKVQDGSG